MTSFTKARGFTVVELLIVIVVIGILAALVLNAFAGAQQRAKIAQAQTDLKALNDSVYAARLSADKQFHVITGSDCTGCSCTAHGDVALYTLPKTDDCWVDYYAALDAMEDAGANAVQQLRKGDPWGNPYILDENEGVPGLECDYEDMIQSVGPDGKYDTYSDNIFKTISRYSQDC